MKKKYRDGRMSSIFFSSQEKKYVLQKRSSSPVFTSTAGTDFNLPLRTNQVTMNHTGILPLTGSVPLSYLRVNLQEKIRIRLCFTLISGAANNIIDTIRFGRCPFRRVDGHAIVLPAICWVFGPGFFGIPPRC